MDSKTPEDKSVNPNPSSRIEKKGQAKAAGKSSVKKPKAPVKAKQSDAPSAQEKKEEKEIGWYGMPMSKKRRFPVWLRLLTLFVLCAIALVIGAMVGFGVVGHGHALDVFRVDTWVHIMKFITKGT